MTIYHQLGEYHQPVNSNKISVQHLPVSCVGGAQGKPLRWRVEERPCHNYIHKCGLWEKLMVFML